MASRQVASIGRNVRLSEETVSRLQRLLHCLPAPQRGTLESVVIHLLDEHDARDRDAAGQGDADRDVEIDPNCVLSVMNHTAVVSVVLHDGALATKLFCGCDNLTVEGDKPTWNGLVKAMLRKLKDDAIRFRYDIPGFGRNESDPAALCEWLDNQSLGGNISPIPDQPDAEDTRLWYSVPGLGVRFQGLSSQQAWRTVRTLVWIMQRLAASTVENRIGQRHGGIGLDLRVKWAERPGAYAPGRYGLVSIQQFSPPSVQCGLDRAGQESGPAI